MTAEVYNAYRLVDTGDGGGVIRLKIYPQKNIGKYRVDFFIEADMCHFTDVTLPNGTKEQKEVNNRLTMVVECDGHDFHERTKEQAARDKKRDRILQSLGYKVFHFTGSEIFNGSIQCAEEILKVIEDRYDQECSSDQKPANG